MPSRLASLGRFIIRSARKHRGGDDLVQVGWVSATARRNHRGVVEAQKRYLDAQRDG